MVTIALCLLAVSATTILAHPLETSNNGLRIVSVLNGQDKIDEYIKAHSKVHVVNLAKDQPGHVRILGVFQGKDEIVQFASKNNVRIRVPEGTPQDLFAPAAAPSSPRSAQPPPSNPRSLHHEPRKARKPVATNPKPSQGKPVSTDQKQSQGGASEGEQPAKKVGPIQQQLNDWNKGIGHAPPNFRLLYEEQKQEYELGERDEPPDESLLGESEKEDTE